MPAVLRIVPGPSVHYHPNSVSPHGDDDAQHESDQRLCRAGACRLHGRVEESEISMPSLPTERNATTITATGPMRKASESFPRSSAEIVRAVPRIQKIMPVTRVTARMDRPPPTSSRVSKSVAAVPYV